MAEENKLPKVIYNFKIGKAHESCLKRSYNGIRKKLAINPAYEPEYQLHRFDSFEDLQTDIIKRIAALFDEALENRFGLEDLRKIEVSLDDHIKSNTFAWYSSKNSTRKKATIGINYWMALRMPYQKVPNLNAEQIEDSSRMDLRESIEHELDHARDFGFLSYRDALFTSLPKMNLDPKLIANLKVLSDIRSEGLASFANIPLISNYFVNKIFIKDESELTTSLKGQFFSNSEALAKKNRMNVYGLSDKEINPYATGLQMMNWIYFERLSELTKEKDLEKLVMFGLKNVEIGKAVVSAVKQDALIDCSIGQAWDRYYGAARKFKVAQEDLIIPKEHALECLALEN
jgi:hypothetical protein